MMGIRLIKEVLEHAPPDLTSGERLLLLVLAEDANDISRKGWPGMETVTRRSGLSERGVRKTLERLAERGYELRVAVGTDKNGKTVFACRGHATVYLFPAFAPSDGGTPVPALKEKGGTGVPERRYCSTEKAVPQYRPSSQVPSRSPQTPSGKNLNGNGKPGWLDSSVDLVAARLTKATGRTYDRRDLTESVLGFLSGKTVTNPGAFIRKCADDNPLQFMPTPSPPRYQREERS